MLDGQLQIEVGHICNSCLDDTKNPLNDAFILWILFLKYSPKT